MYTNTWLFTNRCRSSCAPPLIPNNSRQNRTPFKEGREKWGCDVYYSLLLATGSNNGAERQRPRTSPVALPMGRRTAQAGPEPGASYQARIRVHGTHAERWIELHCLAAQGAEGGWAHRWHACATVKFSPVQVAGRRGCGRVGVHCWAGRAERQRQAVPWELSYWARARERDKGDDRVPAERAWYGTCGVRWRVAGWAKVERASRAEFMFASCIGEKVQYSKARSYWPKARQLAYFCTLCSCWVTKCIWTQFLKVDMKQNIKCEQIDELHMTLMLAITGQKQDSVLTVSLLQLQYHVSKRYVSLRTFCSNRAAPI
jgi:hypothetical protein